MGAATAAAPDLAGTVDLGIALPVDLVNQLMHARWASAEGQSLQSGDYADLLPEGVTLEFATALSHTPLVLDDCGGDARLRSVGKLVVGMQVDGESLTLDLTGALEADMTAEAADGVLRLAHHDASVEWLTGLGPIPETREAEVVALLDAIFVDALARKGLADATAWLPAPAVALDGVAVGGLWMQARGILEPRVGYLELVTCPDVACDLYTLACDGDSVEVCTPMSTTCAVWETDQACADEGLVCDDTAGDPVCMDAD